MEELACHALYSEHHCGVIAFYTRPFGLTVPVASICPLGGSPYFNFHIPKRHPKLTGRTLRLPSSNSYIRSKLWKLLKNMGAPIQLLPGDGGGLGWSTSRARGLMHR